MVTAGLGVAGSAAGRDWGRRAQQQGSAARWDSALGTAELRLGTVVESSCRRSAVGWCGGAQRVVGDFFLSES